MPRIDDTINLPNGMPLEVIAEMKGRARHILETHGFGAFAMPREAAIVHETGHAIVGTHEGIAVRSISIHSRIIPMVGMAWGGLCASNPWMSGPTIETSSAEDDLRHSRFVIAGIAAETLCGLDKPGSSLDEQFTSQYVSANAARKLADHGLNDAEFSAFAERLWHEQVWKMVITILRRNETSFQTLANHLREHKRARGKKLRTMLGSVCKTTN
jgi:hypothetical protein